MDDTLGTRRRFEDAHVCGLGAGLVPKEYSPAEWGVSIMRRHSTTTPPANTTKSRDLLADEVGRARCGSYKPVSACL